MSNARIQFSLASEEVWNACNPLLKEGEIVTVLKANKKVKLVQGKVGGSTYSESTVIWDEDVATSYVTMVEDAVAAAEKQSTSAASAANNANTAAKNAAESASSAASSESNAKKYMEQAKKIANFNIAVTDDGAGNVNMKF